jgi:hypothetical protein
MDLFLWKPLATATMSRGLVYLHLAEDVPGCAVAPFPDHEVQGLLRERFGDDPPFELEIDERHLSVSIPWGERADHAAAWMGELATRLGLELYDPQSEEPTEEDVDEFDAAREASERALTSDELGRWRAEVAAGNVEAMNEIGNAYAFGEGVPEDDVEAFRWYQRAAEAGSVNALANVANAHRVGQGTPKDATRAFDAYERLYRLQPRLATFELAEMLMAGEGVTRDTERALSLLREARPWHPDARALLRSLGE